MDIDAFAGCIAYAELLNLQGVQARAVSTAPINESVTSEAQQWAKDKMVRTYSADAHDSFTIIDLSDPKYFDNFVEIERIVEVIDHHIGFEQFWRKKIGKGATIEFIGAACTLVYEKWKQADLLPQISRESARLLVCGILDNTLNFGAQITTQRDHVAAKDLAKYAGLPEDWSEHYFRECEKTIQNDLTSAITNATKIMNYNTYTSSEIQAIQLVVWDANAFIKKNITSLTTLLNPNGTFFINLIDLSKKQSSFYCTNESIQQWLKMVVSVSFQGSIGQTDRFWLRKEIAKQDETLYSTLSSES
jgi:inorganic pyrophosphatase/exopolyphosphatase